MRHLSIFIEITGEQKFVGSIVGESYNDACFQYSREYLDSVYAAPISISLPLQEEVFSSSVTRNFFEGLLPEGFSRKAVANWIKTDENDYMTILATLGSECLGAIKVIDDDLSGSQDKSASDYEKLSVEQVKALAEEGASKSTQVLLETHLSLTGATGKVGLYYDDANDDWYLPTGDAPSTHIVKQSHVRLERIVLNEQLCMLTAHNLGIDIPETFIVDTGSGADSDILYATKRYDRVISDKKVIDGLKVPIRLHQEDFAQAMGISASDKYEKEDSGYIRRMFDLVRFYCSDPIMEQNKLWKRICFNFLIGNTDCHIKNYSLVYNDNLKNIKLSPAYDIVSTRIYNMTKEMSFYIGGELDIERLNRASFSSAAATVGIPERLAMKIFDETAEGFEDALSRASAELGEKGFGDADKMQADIIRKGGYANL